MANVLERFKSLHKQKPAPNLLYILRNISLIRGSSLTTFDISGILLIEGTSSVGITDITTIKNAMQTNFHPATTSLGKGRKTST